MATYNTDTIVLKQFDLGEADKIITFCSRKKGQVRAVAKNARKSGRFSGALLPFTYNNITFYHGKSLDKINHVENIYSFSSLRDDLKKMSYASYMAEIVKKVGVEEKSQPALFSLLLSVFNNLISLEEKQYSGLNLIFKFKILCITGHRPILEYCSECGTKIERKNKVFNIAAGGAICRKCSAGFEGEIFQITGEAQQFMKKYIDSGMIFPEDIYINFEIINNLNEFLDRFILYHLDIHLKSLDFLNMIEDFG